MGVAHMEPPKKLTRLQPRSWEACWYHKLTRMLFFNEDQYALLKDTTFMSLEQEVGVSGTPHLDGRESDLVLWGLVLRVWTRVGRRIRLCHERVCVRRLCGSCASRLHNGNVPSNQCLSLSQSDIVICREEV